MSLLAHVESAGVNVWGFAYVGGIVGLFASGLYFVQRRLAPTADTAPSTKLASIGRLIVVVGALTGAGLGLGIGLIIEAVGSDSHSEATIVVQVQAPPPESGSADTIRMSPVTRAELM